MTCAPSSLSQKTEYAFGEPFLQGDHDLRLQKIGKDNYRVFERRATRSNDWKTNDCWCEVVEVPAEKVQQRHKLWLDAAQKMFGEEAKMDIVTIDILVTKTNNKEYVLEVNGTSSGFLDFDDQLTLGKLILERIEEVVVEMKNLNDEHQEFFGKQNEVVAVVDTEETQKRKAAINGS